MLNKYEKERVYNIFDQYYEDILLEAKTTILILGIFVIPLLPYKLILLPSYFIYLFFAFVQWGRDKKHYSFLIPFSLIIIVLFMLATTMYNSYSKRFNKDDFAISFIEENKQITTEDGKSNLNYLGETSTNIFLYDIKEKKARIYNKSKISNIEINNLESIDNWILKIENSIFIRAFKEYYEN